MGDTIRITNDLLHKFQLKNIRQVYSKTGIVDDNLCDICEKESRAMDMKVNISIEGESVKAGEGYTKLTVFVNAFDGEKEAFNIETEYWGNVNYPADDPQISQDQVDFFLKVQAVPMLWSYVREFVDNTCLRMKVPPLYLKVINVGDLIRKVQ